MANTRREFLERSLAVTAGGLLVPKMLRTPQVRVEPALANDYSGAIDQLRERGHVIADKREAQGDAHSIWLDPRSGELVGAADRRESGSAAGY